MDRADSIKIVKELTINVDKTLKIGFCCNKSIRFDIDKNISRFSSYQLIGLELDLLICLIDNSTFTGADFI